MCSVVQLFACDKNDDNTGGPSSGLLQISTAQIGNVSILSSDSEVPAASEITLVFSSAVNTELAATEINLVKDSGIESILSFEFLDNNKIIRIAPNPAFAEGEDYILTVSSDLVGAEGESFGGVSLPFKVSQVPLSIVTLTENGTNISANARNTDIALQPEFALTLNYDVEEEVLQNRIVLVGNQNVNLNVTKIGEATYTIASTENLRDLTKYNLLFPSSIGTDAGRIFENVSYSVYTGIDEENDFPTISDEELMTLVQEQTFKYFWDFAHPISGLARERNTSGDIVTTGGSGFGLMSIIVGVERDFITRAQAVERWQKIMNFLESADRFHGAWSHWLNGNSGAVVPFSLKDNGGDIVETAFLLEGMLTVRQYLDATNPAELALISQITELYEGVEWTWYTQGQNVIYWHWSPEYNFEMNLRVQGHNETQMVYILAAASPTFPIEKEIYDNGYARNGDMQNGSTFYDITLPLGSNLGGPLFFSHYTYLGLDTRNLSDAYANYNDQTRNHTLVNRAYCIDNPMNYVGYSADCWGLTASDGDTGYSAHSPSNDRGVITPTAALSSMPYTPEESMDAMRFFYYKLGDRLWGEYGFYDAFNLTEGWTASSSLAIDQGPIICGIENHRTELLWDLFMSAEEVQSGLDLLEFSY